MHENWQRDQARPPLSPRIFGFGAAALLGAAWLLTCLHGHPRAWELALALALALVATLAPAWLAPASRGWLWLAAAMARVTNPVMMALAYGIVITPAALVLRLAGWDPLRRHSPAGAPTYWIERVPPGPDPAALRDPF